MLLYCLEDGDRALYYQGWFRFPLGHYKRVLEHNTRRSYLKDWLRMEHWIDPAETFIDLGTLRRVIQEWNVETDDRPDEAVVAVGEQASKRHTLVAPNHHAIGIDGVVMYRDRDDALLLHVLPLSYERHTLIGHHLVAIPHALGVEPQVEEAASKSTSPEAAHPGRDQSAREVSS